MAKVKEKADDVFPKLLDVIPERANRPGLEWAYILGEDAVTFQKKGWRMTPGAKLVEVEEKAYVVMNKGKALPGTVRYVPQVMVQADQ